MSTDAQVIAAVDLKTWQGVVNRLNQRGIFFETDRTVSFLAKDIIRSNQRSIKIRLRRNGFSGTAIAYIEENIQNCNGYAFYDKARFTRERVLELLGDEIRATFR